MADYSGDFDAYSTRFYPDQTRPWFWGSSKTFGEPETVVPKEYLGYLIDLLVEYQKRTGEAKKVSIILRDDTYVLKGIALSEGSAKVRERLGWENQCRHTYIIQSSRGYSMCYTCSEIFCEHDNQTLHRKDGVVGRWTCDDCGKEVDNGETL